MGLFLTVISDCGSTRRGNTEENDIYTFHQVVLDNLPPLN